MSEVQESSRIFEFKKVEIIASWNTELKEIGRASCRERV